MANNGQISVNFCLLLFEQLVHSSLCVPPVHDRHVDVADDELDRLYLSNRRVNLCWVDSVQLSLESIDQLLTIDEHLECNV